jgi:hypothetical protein
MGDMNNTTPSKVIKHRPGFYSVGNYRILKSKSLGMTFFYVYEQGKLTRNVAQDRSAKPFLSLREATAYTTEIGA